jgi:hypothetical protein
MNTSARREADRIYVPYTRIIASVDAVVAGLHMTRESLDAAGYATTTIEQPRVSVSAKDRLLLNCRLRHLKKDGSLLAERANFYVLVRTAGSWKVGGHHPAGSGVCRTIVAARAVVVCSGLDRSEASTQGSNAPPRGLTWFAADGGRWDHEPPRLKPSR